LCTDLVEQKGAENNKINSHAQDAIALKLNILLCSKLEVLLTNMYRFVCPELPLSRSLFFLFSERSQRSAAKTILALTESFASF